MPHGVRQSVTIAAALTTLVGALVGLPADAGAGGGNLVGAILGVAGAVTNNPSIKNVVTSGSALDTGGGLTTGLVRPDSAAIAPKSGSGSVQLLGTPQANVRPPAHNLNIPGLPDEPTVNQQGSTAAADGFGALVAPGARNAGAISATLGTAGSAITLDFYGDRLITLAVDNQTANQVTDAATGKPLKSLNRNDKRNDGGRVTLSAAAARAVVNAVVKSGAVEAASVGTRNGMIVLGAATAKDTATRDKGTHGGAVNTAKSISPTAALADLGAALKSSSFVSELVGGNVRSVAPSDTTGSPGAGPIGDLVPALTSVVGGVGLVNGKALTGLLATTLTQTNDLLAGAAALTNGVGGVVNDLGLLNVNALTGLLTTTLTQTDSLLGALGNAVSDLTDPALTPVLALLPDAPGLQTPLQSRLDDPLTVASLAPGDVANALASNRAPESPPPQFGSRFFVVPPPGETRFIADEAVLHIPSGIAPAQIQALMSRLGLQVLASQRLGLLGVTSYQVRIRNGSSVAAVIRALFASRIVAGAQPNFTYRLTQDPVQPAQAPALASAPQEGDAAQYALSKLGVIGIHRELKGSGVAVAIIDSQIDVRHPDLDGVIADQFDAVGRAEPPHPHGTGMAGAVAAHHRLMGIAPGVRLYAIHAFTRDALSFESTTFNVLKGLDWAARKGVRVINMSFAGPRDTSLERAIKVAHDSGIVLIAAAGNGGPRSEPLYPGADPNVIAVTATDGNDRVFARANRGRYIAVAAPGVDILLPAPDNSYQIISGTSVSAAEVSGVAALLLERNPQLKPDDIRDILTATATRVAGKDRDDDYGSGLVDPAKAIQAAGDMSSVGIAAALPRPEASLRSGR
jgi:hypothetical protein